MLKSVKNVEIAGYRTSFRLEETFWRAANDCARDRGISVGQLFTQVVEEGRDHRATMTSMVRTYFIGHYRDRAMNRKGA